MNNNKGQTKYPKEIFDQIKTVTGKKQMFSVTSELSWSENKPLTMDNLSRYVFTGADIFPNGNKVVCVANLPANEVAAVFDEYQEITLTENIKGLLSVNNNDDTWPKNDTNKKVCMALNFQPKMGMNKGKPYYEFARNIDLEKQRQYLMQNIEKYPANKNEVEVIDTILAASQTPLPDGTNQLDKCIAFMCERAKKVGGVSSGPITIYDSGIKPRMSKSKQSPNGVELKYCYALKIVYDVSRNYPFMVLITNCWAPVTTTSTGSLNVQMSSATEINKVTVNLSKFDGRRMFNAIKEHLDWYANTTYSAQHKKAAQISIANAAAAKAANQASQTVPSENPPITSNYYANQAQTPDGGYSAPQQYGTQGYYNTEGTYQQGS